MLLSPVSLKGSDSLTTPKKQTRFVPAPEPAVTGDGEDYFLSLFGDSKKLLAHSFHSERTWRHFSMILEEVGQSRSRYIFYSNYLVSSIGVTANTSVGNKVLICC